MSSSVEDENSNSENESIASVGSKQSQSKSRSVSPFGSVQSKGSNSSSQSSSSNASSRSPSPVHSITSDKVTGRNSSKSSSISPSRSRSRSKSISKSKSRSRSKSNDSSDSDVVTKKKNKKDETIAEDIFGEASDISSSDSEDNVKRGATDSEGNDAEESDEEKDSSMVKEEETAQSEIPQETTINAEIPKINANLGSNMYFVKLPNFLSVDTRPFDPATYEDEVEDDDIMDEEGRTRLKLRVENTIRWRYVKDENGVDVLNDDGSSMKQSNSRVVRWSDGSMSLHLGAEIFDIHPMSLQNDFNHLFIRQGTGLQAQAVFKSKLTFRPHSTDSFTHRKMTMSLADKNNKTRNIRILPIAGTNPESEKIEKMRKEEVRLRTSIRQESHKNRLRERQQHSRLSSSYLEGDDHDDEENSIKAMKNVYKQKIKEAKQIFSDSDEDGDISGGGGGSGAVASGGGDTDDSDIDNKRKKKKINSPIDEEMAEPLQKRKKVIESSDED